MFNAADKEKVHGVGGVILRHVIPNRPKFWFRYPKLLQLNVLLLGALVCDVTNGFDQSMLNSKFRQRIVGPDDRTTQQLDASKIQKRAN